MKVYVVEIVSEGSKSEKEMDWQLCGEKVNRPRQNEQENKQHHYEINIHILNSGAVTPLVKVNVVLVNRHTSGRAYL